jgi:hypothetical protein
MIKNAFDSVLQLPETIELLIKIVCFEIDKEDGLNDLLCKPKKSKLNIKYDNKTKKVTSIEGIF